MTVKRSDRHWMPSGLLDFSNRPLLFTTLTNILGPDSAISPKLPFDRHLKIWRIMSLHGDIAAMAGFIDTATRALALCKNYLDHYSSP